MSQWFYAIDEQRYGPVAVTELLALYAKGRIDPSSLIWRDGMPSWQPLSMHAVEIGIPGSKPASTSPSLATGPLPSEETAAPPPPPKPGLDPARAAPQPTPYAPPRAAPTGHEQSDRPVVDGQVVQAGFLRRWAALIIDTVIVGGSLIVIVLVGVAVFGGFSGGLGDSEATGAAIQIGYYLLYFIAAPIYFAGMESSARQATLGKMAIGIKVCDAQGRRLGFAQALGRWAAAALSYVTLYIGFLMAAFTEKKQALHDLIAGTLVVDKWAYTEFPERQKTGSAGCLVIALVLLLPAIFVLGILMAIAIPAYSDYTSRAKVSEALIAASGAKIGVAEYVFAEEQCPQSLDELDISAPSSRYVSSLEVGADADGNCVIEISVTGIEGAADGQRLWLTRESDTRWTCSSELPNRMLPATCR